ncbi:PAS and ANTAR domain-containing protein [Streptomyces sp. ODS28]|uniref:PAS and ANTAR domain-containing protein n=1 Tax=Streptomyces sp. ODS28 TaxID=3136688 RepID=UPI0031E69148
MREQTRLPSGETGQPVGVYRYLVAEGRWWWSDEVYRLCGLKPGEVEPSTELLMSHLHPQDKARAASVFRWGLEQGDPFSLYHRLLDVAGRERRVVVAGDGQRVEDGQVAAVRGFFIDLTEPVARDIKEHSDRSITAARRSQEAIDQARGVLMAVYGIDADAAWTLLRWGSQNTNVKLRDLAAALIGAVTENGGGESLRARVERMLCPPDGPGPRGGPHP